MSNMRCPFCNELLIITNKNLVSCQNLHCEIGNLPMPLIVVKEMARTKKQLEIAVDTLHWYDDNYDSVVARNTLDEIKTITELEQKDK